jgi:hypothetical protein
MAGLRAVRHCLVMDFTVTQGGQDRSLLDSKGSMRNREARVGVGDPSQAQSVTIRA